MGREDPTNGLQKATSYLERQAVRAGESLGLKQEWEESPVKLKWEECHSSLVRLQVRLEGRKESVILLPESLPGARCQGPR